MFTISGVTWSPRGFTTGTFSFDTASESEALSVYGGLFTDEDVREVYLDEDGFCLMSSETDIGGFPWRP